VFPIRSVRYLAKFFVGSTSTPALTAPSTRPIANLFIARCDDEMLPVSHSTMNSSPLNRFDAST